MNDPNKSCPVAKKRCHLFGKLTFWYQAKRLGMFVDLTFGMKQQSCRAWNAKLYIQESSLEPEDLV
jgi:hypothetical protein